MLTITFAGIEREIATLQMEVGSVNRHLESGFNSFICGSAKIQLLLQEKKLLAEIKKTAKTGNEVRLSLCPSEAFQ